MKRSEMLNSVAWYLEERYKFQSDAAREILDLIESKGMRPPAYDKLVEANGVTSPYPDMKLYYKLPCNEWEPE